MLYEIYIKIKLLLKDEKIFVHYTTKLNWKFYLKI
jgi:hypothetical protein